MAEVAAILLDDGVVVMDDGQCVPITNVFDEDGDECDLDDEVYSLVAGPVDGQWLALEIGDDPYPTVH